MPWIYRDKKRYYYQPITTPESQYRMRYAGVAGSRNAMRAEKEDNDKKEQKALRQQGNKEVVSLMEEFDTFQSMTDVIVRLSLLLNGHYLRRSELRNMRKNDED